MTGGNLIRFSTFILQICPLYISNQKVVFFKCFSFSINNRERRWLAQTMSNMIRFSTLYFNPKCFCFSINNRVVRRWLAGTQSDLLTSTLFCPEAVFQVQRSMNVTQRTTKSQCYIVLYIVLHNECIKTENTQVEEKVVQVARVASGALVHCCTIFLCCLDAEIYHHRNPNMKNRDHLVG